MPFVLSLRIFNVLPLIMAISCAHQIPLSGPENCAWLDMEMESVSIASSASSHVSSTGVGIAGESESISYQCRKPETDEKCAIEARKAATREIVDYNNSVKTRNIFMGIGYAAFVLPGFAVFAWSMDNAKNAEALRDRTYKKKSKECKALL